MHHVKERRVFEAEKLFIENKKAHHPHKEDGLEEKILNHCDEYSRPPEGTSPPEPAEISVGVPDGGT